MIPLPATALLADIGGTNARFVLVEPSGAERAVTFACADHGSLESAIRAALVLLGAPTPPPLAALAVAAPITGDQVALTNLPWSFSCRALAGALGFERLEVINDFTAIALGVPHLGPDDCRPIGGGSAVAGAPIAVLGPGSGLGVSGLVPADARWIALSGEGGHVTMAAADDRESDVLAVLRGAYGHVSAERVVSGPGLVALYQAVAALNGRTPAPMTAAAVTEAALTDASPDCVEAVHLFASFLGTVAGNVALTLGARGGVFIGGGIGPRLADFLDRSAFRARFTAKGRHTGYLSAIPTTLIIHPLPAFLGLATLLTAGEPS